MRNSEDGDKYNVEPEILYTIFIIVLLIVSMFTIISYIAYIISKYNEGSPIINTPIIITFGGVIIVLFILYRFNKIGDFKSDQKNTSLPQRKWLWSGNLTSEIINVSYYILDVK